MASDKNVERDRGDRGDRGGSQKMKKVGTGGPGTASGANGLALHLSGGFFPRRLLLPGPVVHATLIAFTSAARSSTSLPCVRRSLREACGCETRANRTCVYKLNQFPRAHTPSEPQLALAVNVAPKVFLYFASPTPVSPVPPVPAHLCGNWLTPVSPLSRLSHADAGDGPQNTEPAELSQMCGVRAAVG